MSDSVQDLLLSWKKQGLMQNGARPIQLSLACSGGADSIALLFLLLDYQEQSGQKVLTRILHVNHGWRAEAKQEEAYVHELALQYGLAFVSAHLSPKQGGEEEARDFRRQFFSSFASPGQGKYIALAHHQEDQTETLLLQLFRGGGLRALAAMKPLDGAYWRPLLQISPADLKNYLRKKKIPWFEDPSNRDRKYQRNFLRHEILPLLRNRFGENFDQRLNKTSRIVREAVDTWEGEAQQLLDQQGSLTRDILLPLTPNLRHELFRLFLQREGLSLRDLRSQHYEAMEQLLMKGRDGRVDLPGKMSLSIAKGTLRLQKTREASYSFVKDLPRRLVDELEHPLFYLPITYAQGELLLGSWKSSFSAKEVETLCLRYRKAGDRYLLTNGQHQLLKKHLQTLGIHAKDRDFLLLLARDDEVLWPQTQADCRFIRNKID